MHGWEFLGFQISRAGQGPSLLHTTVLHHLKSFFMLSASTAATAGSPCQVSLVSIFVVKLAVSLVSSLQ